MDLFSSGAKVTRIDVATYQLETLVEAACQYELVMELLLIIHEMYNGHELEPQDSDLIKSASMAALLAKAERIHQGIDQS